MSYHHQAARGGRHGLAKLSRTRVKNLRRKAAEGATQASLAKEYGVSPSTVSLIVRRATWTHLP